MLHIIVREEGKNQDWLINPAHIGGIQFFTPEANKRNRADIHMCGLLHSDGTGAYSYVLQTYDPASIKRLRAIDAAPKEPT